MTRSDYSRGCQACHGPSLSLALLLPLLPSHLSTWPGPSGPSISISLLLLPGVLEATPHRPPSVLAPW